MAKDVAQRLRDLATYSTTYTKAVKLLRSGGVLSCDVEQGAIGSTVYLSGLLRSSTPSKAYRARVTLDLSEDDVVDYYCSCPMGGGYGMCKHEIALALSYVEGSGSLRSVREEEPPEVAEEVAAQGGPVRVSATGGKSRRPGPRPLPPMPSSPQIADLIASATVRRANEASRKQTGHTEQAGDSDEPVELLVELSGAAFGTLSSGPDGTWLLKLRVRRGKASYVVKNVADLTRAYAAGQEFSYGKRLSFAHVPEAFTERSRELLDFATRVVKSQQALFNSRYNYREAGRGADVKELPLSWADVVDLLDILQGATLSFNPGGYPVPPTRELAVTAEDPKIRARIEPAREGGYNLVMPPELVCFASQKALYVLDGTRAMRTSSEYAAAATELFEHLLPSRYPLYIGASDLPEFCRSILGRLQSVVELDAPDALFALVPPEPAFSFKIGLEDGLVFCEARVAYGDRELGLYDPKRPGQPARDLVAEYHVQDVLERYFLGVAGDLHFDESDDEQLFVLLTDGLQDLGALGEVQLSERLRQVKVRGVPQIRVKASVKSGLLDVTVDSAGMSPRDLVAYLASYKKKQRYVRLSNGDIARIGSNLQEVDSLAQGLGTDVVRLAEGVTGLPQNRALFVDALLKKAERVRLDRSPSFRAIVRDFETFQDADIEMPASLDDILRSYQVAGVRWLGTLERLGFGGILADDMGLGKTLQVIAHVLACAEASGGKGDDGSPAAPGASRQTTLVVAPASLVYNWCAEFARFAPGLDVAAVVGTKAERTKIIAAARDHDVLVSSYDLMKRDVEAYMAQHFTRVVLDEAQYIKNPGTQVAKCAKCLPADIRFALTGTPIENRLAELWSIFDFLMPGILGTRDEFAKRFESPVEHGEAEATRRLQCMVSPFILRRLKADVLADLPDKTESVVVAKMAPEQLMLYRANQDNLALQIQHKQPEEFKREKLKVLAELTKLRQICCDPRLCYEDYAGGSAKLDTCMELVQSAVEAGHQVLVFSQFTSMLELLGERLRTKKLNYLTLTGATSKEARSRLVAQFQAGEAPVFLISLKAGGVGLNLTAADVVIHYDPWWNLAAQNQATDRAHRIGQKRAVSVFKLIAEGTVEERIVKMQERKQDLAEAVLGGEGLASSRITRDDVLALLGA